MNRNNILIALGTIVLIFIPIAIYATFGGEKAKPGQYDQLAQCLTDKGTKMYGAFWCSHCAAQKEAFGTSFEKINYVECSTLDGKGQLEICQDASINGYPTWEFSDGSRLEGEVSLENLAQKAGCELPSN